jgi:hypothetical protein
MVMVHGVGDGFSDADRAQIGRLLAPDKVVFFNYAPYLDAKRWPRVFASPLRFAGPLRAFGDEAGDVLAYLASPSVRADISHGLAQVIRDNKANVVVAHSLGTCIAVDALDESDMVAQLTAKQNPVNLLIGLGSPLWMWTMHKAAGGHRTLPIVINWVQGILDPVAGFGRSPRVAGRVHRPPITHDLLVNVYHAKKLIDKGDWL